MVSESVRTVVKSADSRRPDVKGHAGDLENTLFNFLLK